MIFGDAFRIVVAVLILAMLARAARAAWHRRQLSVDIWRAIRPRHVVGSLGLMVGVLAVVLTLITLLPVTGLGLGSLAGLDGNAVFAPIDGALEAPIEAAVQAEATGRPAPGIPWTDVAAVTAFLAVLVLLFPSLAHTEEVVFRVGWEDYDLSRQIVHALRFGAAHLIMLIPVGAAVGVGVAGFVYGRIYRRAYVRNAVEEPVYESRRMALAVDDAGLSRLVYGPPTPLRQVNVTAARRAAVFDAAVWHTTFNTTIAVLVWVGYVSSL